MEMKETREQMETSYYDADKTDRGAGEDRLCAYAKAAERIAAGTESENHEGERHYDGL